MALELTYRDDFSGPRDRAAVCRLLRDLFAVGVAPLEEMNLWDPTYRAFSYLDEAGCCVANRATFTLPLIVNSRPVAAMGIQSVATLPSWRRRGLSHDLLERALRWCDANTPLTFLMTSIPGFYEPWASRSCRSSPMSAMLRARSRPCHVVAAWTWTQARTARCWRSFFVAEPQSRRASRWTAHPAFLPSTSWIRRNSAFGTRPRLTPWW
jgi:GNAT superfamily N-acetyltransferase